LDQLVGSTRTLIVRLYIEDSGGTARALRGGVYGDEKTYTRSLDITAVGLVSETKEVRAPRRRARSSSRHVPSVIPLNAPCRLRHRCSSR